MRGGEGLVTERMEPFVREKLIVARRWWGISDVAQPVEPCHVVFWRQAFEELSINGQWTNSANH